MAPSEVPLQCAISILRNDVFFVEDAMQYAREDVCLETLRLLFSTLETAYFWK